MLQKVLASFGSGGAKVDARLLDRSVAPAGTLHGEVGLRRRPGRPGGRVARGDPGGAGPRCPASTVSRRRRRTCRSRRVQLSGREVIKAGAQVRVPFEVQLPWETPIGLRCFGPATLTGMAVGCRPNLDPGGHRGGDPQDVDAGVDRAAARPSTASWMHFVALGFSSSASALAGAATGWTGWTSSCRSSRTSRFGPSPRGPRRCSTT